MVVDQMADHALALADRGYVMEGGRFVASGSAAELRGSALGDIYFGGQKAPAAPTAPAIKVDT